MQFPSFSSLRNLFHPPSTAIKPITFKGQAECNGAACTVFSNQYAEDRLRGREPAFLRDTGLVVKIIMDAAYIGMWRGVLGIRHDPLNAIQGGNSTIRELSDKGQLSAALQKHNLISYPGHTIYFEKETSDQCRLFDAHQKEGERKGPCSELIQAVGDTAFRHLNPENRVVLRSTDATDRDDPYWLI